MQDFIFNSRHQARRRRRALMIKLLLLALAAGGGYWAYQQFTANSGALTDAPLQHDKGNTLPLPPIEKTRPVGQATTPAIPQTRPLNTVAPTTSPLAEQNSAPSPNIADPTLHKPTALKPNTPRFEWHTHKVTNGESLALIFKKLGLSSKTLYRLTSQKAGRALNHIRPGQEIRIALDENKQLQQLVWVQDPITQLHFQYDEAKSRFVAQKISKPVEKRYRSASGIIESSLFTAGQKAGLDDTLIMNLANIFGWDIDFALEIQDGDQFHVVYEEYYLDGKKLKNGPILAAEFINKGRSYKAVRYTDSSGDTSYYDDKGHAKRRAFIRTPVKFTRISSGFTRKRWHPVLKRWRSHKGVDYAAPRGTPVKATGNGRVAFKGTKGGYGKVIFLHHGGKYTTVYGHLSRFAKGLKTGSKVKQGQIIGYVGSSGLATGPHLHYEFRVHGKHQNPLTIKLPKSIQLPKKELARFKRKTQPLFAQLDELRAKTMIASAAH